MPSQHAEHVWIAGVIIFAVPVIAFGLRQYRKRCCADTRSTTSSTGGGPSAYENKKAVDEYLQMHYATADELIPYSVGPKVSRAVIFSFRMPCRFVNVSVAVE